MFPFSLLPAPLRRTDSLTNAGLPRGARRMQPVAVRGTPSRTIDEAVSIGVRGRWIAQTVLR